ncbi:MAG TPA: hypothetical protein VIE64_02445 [Solirubrobacterales bacterium]|jgi:hypothetical protein
MRRNLVLTLALAAVLAIAVVAVAAAKFTVFRAGNLVLKADGGVTPKALPKNKLVPVTVNVSGQISAADGGHPAALREVTIDFDKNGTINTKGLPTCKEGQLIARPTNEAERVCKNAIVGSGRAVAEVAFAEQKPFQAGGPLVLFNGGTKGGKTLLFIHLYASVPAPTAIITRVEITKIHKGRYGTHSVSKIERVAGGSGSAISFNLKLQRKFQYKGKTQSYIVAKCPDGHFNANVTKAVFVDEDKVEPNYGTTTLKGTVIRPCTPKG